MIDRYFLCLELPTYAHYLQVLNSCYDWIMKTFIGTIVEESLKDSRFLNQLEIMSVRISAADRQEDRWHLYRVRLSEKQIRELTDLLKTEKWYAHFWDDTTIYAVFPGKAFEMSRVDRATWQPAIDYGLSLDIPAEQLDFLIEEQ